MNLNNLPEFFKGRRFTVVAGVLVVFLIILVVFSSGSKTTPPSVSQPTPSEVQQSKPSDFFSTSQGSQSPEVQKAIAEQTKVDQDYAGWEKSISDSYPWRKKLPLTSEKYYVYFDLNNKVFIGRLYTTSGDNVEQLKADILKILKVDEEIPIENFKFEWNVFPK